MPVSHQVLLATLTALWAFAVLFAGFLSFNSADAELYGTAACGGFLGGFVLAPLFGRAGKIGWAWAIGAGLLATLGGGFCAGIGLGLLSPPDDLIFGAGKDRLQLAAFGAMMALAWSFTQVLPALAWVAGLIGLHLVAKKLAGLGGAGPDGSAQDVIL